MRQLTLGIDTIVGLRHPLSVSRLCRRAEGPYGHSRRDQGPADRIAPSRTRRPHRKNSDMSGRSMHPAAVVGVDGLGGFAAMLLGAASTDVTCTACVPVIVARQHPCVVRHPVPIFDPGNAVLTGKVAGSR